MMIPALSRAGVAAAMVVLAANVLTGQATQAQPSRDAIVAAAQSVISKARYATFITLDAAGAPQARIVDPFPVEPDWIVWIATTSASRKVTEVQREPRVALTYFDTVEQGYVTLTGRAAVVRDPAEKSKRWKEDWAAFYPNKNLGDDYTLIRITTSRLEVSAPSRGMNNDPSTWRPVMLVVR